MNEDWYSLREIARRYKRDRETVRRWIKQGIETPLGRVRLHGKKIGGRYGVTAGALEEFLAQLNDEPKPLPVQRVSSRQAKRDREEALAALR